VQVYNFVRKYTNNIFEKYIQLKSLVLPPKVQNVCFPKKSAKFVPCQIFFTRVFDYTEEWRERALRNSGNHQPANYWQKRCQYPAGNGIIIWTLSWNIYSTNYFTQPTCTEQICACPCGF